MTTPQNASRSTADLSSPGQGGESHLNLDTQLAMLRTEWALDRTQLAWIKAAFTFITASLAIDQGTAALREARVLAGAHWVTGSHVVGITLSIASTIFLTIATIAYIRQSRKLARVLRTEGYWLPPALLISVLVILFGCTLSTLMLIWT